MRNKIRNPWVLVMLIVVGVVIGGLIGDIFKDSIQILSYSKSIGFQPFTLDLIVLRTTIGLMVNFNVASIIGIIFAIIIFSRM
ncbi:MAG: DUF4321 domain-containing protein [Alkaliphilus sp.]|nr:DUF4321 domain-containing protein [Alkaliphilus sp.]